jgi:hypothetical protein
VLLEGQPFVWNLKIDKICVTYVNFSTSVVTKNRPKNVQNRALSKIFGPTRDDVTREWRKLLNEELIELRLSNIIRVIKPRIIIWAGHVARMGRGKVHTGFCWGNLRERDHLENLEINGRIILKWIFMRWDREAWFGFISLRIRTSSELL